MSSLTRTLPDRMLTRCCVACGYDGALLRDGRAVRCARCGCDLRDRPARSYAEMEGLVTGRGGSGGASVLDGRHEAGLVQRWLAFLFIAAVVMLVLLYLAAAALPP